MANCFKYIVLLLLMFFCISDQASAQGVLPAHRYYSRNVPSMTWDNTASNAQIDNGSGTWNATNTTWVISPPTGANQAWIAGYNAIFGGGTGVGAAGTVTVTGTRTVKNLIFNATPSGNFTLTGGTLALQGGILLTNQSATVNSTLTGSINYIKRGSAVLNLGGNNTMSGNIVVSQGTLQLASSTAGGTASFVLGDEQTGSNNIAWQWAGGFQPSNNILVTNNGSGTVTLGAYSAGLNTQHNGTVSLNRSVILYDNSNDRTTFSGIISGNAGTITVDGLGTWNSSLGQVARVTFENNSNSFTGLINILPNKAFQLSGTSVVNNQPINNDGTLVLNAGTNGTTTIGILSGTGTGICEIHSGVTGPQTLSLGNDNASATFSGVIRNAGTGSVQVMNLRKEGSGVQYLNGTCSYTGTTIINNGTLSGTGSIASSSLTTVNSNGAIAGGLGSGSAGVFTSGALVFTAASTAALNVYSNGTTLSRLQVNGTCNLGTTSKINLMEIMPAGTFTIISSTGAMTGTLPTIGTNLSGRAATVTQVGNNLRVTLI